MIELILYFFFYFLIFFFNLKSCGKKKIKLKFNNFYYKENQLKFSK